uniref:MADF domain-containing protein n=1 Tax=Glossina austeni TaxID=7395 RepID=A0A1A9US00_GLOAU
MSTNKTDEDYNFDKDLENDRKLCQIVKLFPCLYDRQSKLYQNKKSCETAWQKISRRFSDTQINIKQRWQEVYRSFVHQLSPNETNSNDHYLYEYLEFLMPYISIPCENDYGVQAKNSDDKSVKAGNDVTTTSKDKVVPGVITDSDTSSADETNSLSEQNVDEGNGLNADASSTSSVTKCQSKVETFIIKPIEDNCKDLQASSTLNGSQRKFENIPITSEEQTPSSTEEEKRRYHFRRACKRPLHEQIVKEVRLEDKRPRRCVERAKTFSEEVTKEKPTAIHPSRKLEVKVAKINLNNKKPLSANKNAQPKQTDIGTYLKASSSRDQSVGCDQPKEYSDTATQTAAGDSTQFDDYFLSTVKTQMDLMNSRQKLNFKSKVYKSLMEVFDDGSNFPNLNEIIELPPAGAPRFHTTTPEELRLMRELVALVQAAKQTPETINANEIANPVAVSPKAKEVTDTTMQTSPLPATPNTTSAPAQFVKDTEILGIPRHIIRKVVKVSGSTGGTLMTQDGEKKRIYRIFPKGPLNSTNYQQGIGASNAGTIYFGPSKSQASTNAPKSAMSTTISTPVSGTLPIKVANTTIGTIHSKNIILTNGKSAAAGTAHVGTMLPPERNKTFTVSNNGGTVAAAQRRAVMARQHPQVLRRYSFCGSGTFNTSNPNNNNFTAIGANSKAPQIKPVVTTRRFAAANSAAVAKVANGEGNVNAPSSSVDTANLVSKIIPNSLSSGNKEVKSTLAKQDKRDDSPNKTTFVDPLQIKSIIKTEVID